MRSAEAEHQVGEILADPLLFPDHLGGPRVYVGRERGVFVVFVDVLADRCDIGPDIAGSGRQGIDRFAPDIRSQRDKFRCMEEIKVMFLHRGGAERLGRNDRDFAPWLCNRFNNRDSLDLERLMGVLNIEVVDAVGVEVGIIAHLPGILSGRKEAGNDGVGVLLAEGEELGDALAVGAVVEFEKGILITRGAEDGEPVFLELLVVEIREVEHQLEVHIEQARHVLRALDIAAHPVEGVCDAREHYLRVATVADRLLGRGNGRGKIAHHSEKMTWVAYESP